MLLHRVEFWSHPCAAPGGRPGTYSGTFLQRISRLQRICRFSRNTVNINTKITFSCNSRSLFGHFSGPRSVSKAPQIAHVAPEGSQELPRALPERPGVLQERPKRLPRAPKSAPRAPQRVLKGIQKRSKGFLRGSQETQKHLREGQESSKTRNILPRGPKIPFRRRF